MRAEPSGGLGTQGARPERSEKRAEARDERAAEARDESAAATVAAGDEPAQ